MDKKLQELQECIEKQKELIEKQKELLALANSYRDAKQYSNIILFSGYAGLFAIWNFTKGDLQKWQVLSVGLCILLSLFIYIVFELYGAWLHSTQVRNQIKEPQEAEQLNGFSEKYMAAWPYFSPVQLCLR